LKYKEILLNERKERRRNREASCRLPQRKKPRPSHIENKGVIASRRTLESGRSTSSNNEEKKIKTKRSPLFQKKTRRKRGEVPGVIGEKEEGRDLLHIPDTRGKKGREKIKRTKQRGKGLLSW